MNFEDGDIVRIKRDVIASEGLTSKDIPNILHQDLEFLEYYKFDANKAIVYSDTKRQTYLLPCEWLVLK